VQHAGTTYVLIPAAGSGRSTTIHRNTHAAKNAAAGISNSPFTNSKCRSRASRAASAGSISSEHIHSNTVLRAQFARPPRKPTRAATHPARCMSAASDLSSRTGSGCDGQVILVIPSPSPAYAQRSNSFRRVVGLWFPSLRVLDQLLDCSAQQRNSVAPTEAKRTALVANPAGARGHTGPEGTLSAAHCPDQRSKPAMHRPAKSNSL